MNMDKFAQQIEEVRQRTEKLNQHVGQSSSPQQNLLVQAFGELQFALEELRVAEEELRVQNDELVVARGLVEQERQRYMDLFDFAPDGYLVTDADGTILEANRAAAHQLQVSKKFLQCKPLVNFIPLEERQAFRTQLLQLRDKEGLCEWEICMVARDGNKFDCSLSVTTVQDLQGNSIGWRWLMRNITARKQADEQIRSIQLQNMQLQEAARIKTQFVANMSHELRTPLHAILGFSQLLLRRYYDYFPPELRSMVERIISSGKHLLTLIEDILDFSTLEAGRLNLQKQEFNLVELVTTVTEELRFLADQKNLTLAIHIDIQNHQIVNDSNRVRQVLVNLLSNAIKFTDTGGVFVEVQQVGQDRVALMVRDTGIGIAEDELKNIFQEFRQVNQSITRRHGGTGLGLAIVDKLLRLMNGKITVKSKLGEGSTFRVELPRQVS
ncbi:MAG: ATP-binding protein [Rhizonema sp. NSF051]|nr:ATP-binding protein [Rhizonema sp. NSF051]